MMGTKTPSRKEFYRFSLEERARLAPKRWG